MTHKKMMRGMAVLVLTFGIMAAGCASAPQEAKAPPLVLGLKLEESLRKYMVPQEQTWGDAGDKTTSVYYLDPLHFEAFKAELDAGREYTQTDSWTDKNRNWERGKAVAQWAERPNGEFELRFMKEDNSVVGYRYKKIDSKSPAVSGRKLEEALRTYMGPSPQTWDEDNVFVYSVDPLQFDAFKAEIDAGGEYYPRDIYTEKNRDWERGKIFARWAARPDGSFQLELCKKDNSVLRYWYKKHPLAGDPKSITITGFDRTLKVTINKHGVQGRFLWINVRETDSESHGAAWGTVLNPGGGDITFELFFGVLAKDDKSWTDNAWTGTGSYYIYIEGPSKDSAKNGGHYYYSVNGVDAAPVDINSAVTTLNWPDFVWYRDW